MLLVVRPGAPNNVLVPSSKDATSSYLLLVVNALVTSSFLLLVVRPGAPSKVLVPSSKGATSSYLLLEVMPLLPVASCS